MKINTKIIMLIAASLIFTAVAIGFLSVWQLRKTGEQIIPLNDEDFEDF
jgi:hypothetical protein